jgi:hypothetical protein
MKRVPPAIPVIWSREFPFVNQSPGIPLAFFQSFMIQFPLAVVPGLNLGWLTVAAADVETVFRAEGQNLRGGYQSAVTIRRVAAFCFTRNLTVL